MELFPWYSFVSDLVSNTIKKTEFYQGGERREQSGAALFLRQLPLSEFQQKIVKNTCFISIL
jgi:hypothetical protein